MDDDVTGAPDEPERDRDLVALEDAEHELAALEAELGTDDAAGT